MNNKDLVKYLDNPHQLGENTIFDLTLLTEQFPYFQTAQLLRIKNLHNISPETIKPALNYTAAYVTDRKILYYLLHPIQIETNTWGEPFKDNERRLKESLKENISETLTTQKDYLSKNQSDEIEFSAALDIRKEYGEGIELNDYVVRINNKSDNEYLELLDTSVKDENSKLSFTSKIPDDKIPGTKPTQKPNDILELINRGVSADEITDKVNLISDRQKKKNDLIDNFIKTNPKIVPRDFISEEISDISERSVKESDHLITDTLADIYLKQGNYAKAIFAYEKLSLKYPEKSAYFAGQIAEIKKLIEKTK